jgi:uncharacterized protein (DUF433 family)
LALSLSEFVMKPLEVGHYLVADPRICFGQLIFRGTRIPVQTILSYLATGHTIDYILNSWPQLKREAVEEAIRLVAAAWPHLMRPDDAEALELWARTVKGHKAEPVPEGQNWIKPLGQYLQVDLSEEPRGQPTFKGTYIPVRPILYFLSQGQTLKQLVAAWPELKREAIAEAIQLAAKALRERYAASDTETAENVVRQVGRHLVSSPTSQGQLTFRGTDVRVESVLLALARGQSLKQILARKTDLTEEAVAEAIQLAAATLVEWAVARARANHEPAYSGRTA